MKYNYNPIKASKEDREEFNKKILSILNNHESYGISKEDIFNAYTGKGGLHGLDRGDFDNYSDYSSAKKEIEEGQFFTPDPVVKAMYDLISPSCSDMIADLTCGMGNFGNYAPEESNFYGCDIDRNAVNVAKCLYPPAHFEANDVRFYDPGVKFDVVFGNPPFNLDFDGTLSQFFYFEKAAELLTVAGFLVLITPLSFLSDDFMDKNKISEIENNFYFIGQYHLPADTFQANIETKVSVWQKKSKNLALYLPYKLELAEYDVVYKAVQNAKAVKEANRDRLKLERNRMYSRYNAEFEDFEFKLDKYLFQVKCQKPEKYSACLNYVREFENQKRPEGLSSEQYNNWYKYNRITPAKVIAYIKYFLKPHKPKRPPCVISDKKYNRRVRHDNFQQTSFKEIPGNPAISSYLDDFTFFDLATREWAHFTDLQKTDLNLAAQKRLAYLQWEQGTGKTAAGFAWALFQMNKYNLDNVYVLAPAIAIENTWAQFLEYNNRSFVAVKNLSDLRRIKKGDFVILSFDALNYVRKSLKKLLKIQCNRIALILDEADNISNPAAIRTKSTLAVFKKSRCIIELSGTLTRNNISESFTQFYLLYGSTSNFLCRCDKLYYEPKPTKQDTAHKKACKRAGIKLVPEKIEDGLVVRCNDKHYNEPFPAYKEGYALFQACFNPVKSTVFGIKKMNQDVFNADELKRIIDYTVITRRFEEIRGEKIYKINQIHCGFNKAETGLYKKIIQEFSALRNNYFNKTGNARKDSLLKIIQQLNLLLKACSIPHTFSEYGSDEDPSKMIEVMELIRDKEKVAIGCTRKETVAEYEKMIREVYPDRPLFVITGDRASIARRRKIVEEMKSQKRMILIATQQALSSSMNIDFIDDVILPELDWNNSKMSQFYFRFIRFSSTRAKNVYFITYENSLEANLLQLIINKDKLNLFMKNQDLNMDELYEKYGVNGNLLDMVLSKEYDPEQECMRIRWDESKIKVSAARDIKRNMATGTGRVTGFSPEQIAIFEKGLLFAS